MLLGSMYGNNLRSSTSSDVTNCKHDPSVINLCIAWKTFNLKLSGKGSYSTFVHLHAFNLGVELPEFYISYSEPSMLPAETFSSTGSHDLHPYTPCLSHTEGQRPWTTGQPSVYSAYHIFTVGGNTNLCSLSLAYETFWCRHVPI